MTKRAKYIVTSISIPEDLFKTIEERRGNTPRSTFICAILKKSLGWKE